MSDAPQTDAFFFRTDIEWDDEVEFARVLERERDEAREAFAVATNQLVQAQGKLREARDKCHQQRMLRLAADKAYADVCHESEEQARLLAMSADREEKLRAALQRITECDMRWSKKVAREALQ